MLPPAKREQIRRQIQDLLQQHGEEITTAMTPLLRETLIRSLPVIEQGIQTSIADHREEWQKLGRRLETEVLQSRLLPLAKDEMLPIVRRNGGPLVEDIGRELWHRASLWRFGWRAIYDRTPLPERELVKEEWRRFVDQEAVPVFEDHLDEIVTVVQATFQDIAANPRVRVELADVAETIADDPEAERLIKVVLKEAIVDNVVLRQTWRDVWASDRARDAMNSAADRVEPVVRQIGDELFGTPETGINPDFARVLRNQILGKDRRWIVADRSPSVTDGPQIPATVRPADLNMPFPLVYIAEP